MTAWLHIIREAPLVLTLDLRPHVHPLRRSFAYTGRLDRREVVGRTRSPDDDWPRRYVLPEPRTFAAVLAAALLASDVPAHRDAAGHPVVRGTDGVACPLDRAEVLAAALSACADLDGPVGGYAESLARVARDDPATAAGYVSSAIAMLGRAGMLPDLPRERVFRPAPVEAADRKAASRERIRGREDETVAAFVDWYLSDANDERPSPGDRVPTVDVQAVARDWAEEAAEAFEAVRIDAANYADDLAAWRRREDARTSARRSGERAPRPALKKPAEVDSWADVAMEEGYPDHPRKVGARRLAQLLAEHLGARHHGRSGDYYLIPDPIIEPQEHTMNPETLWETAVAMREVTDARRDETRALHAQADAVERLLDVQRDQLAERDLTGALHSQRKRLATGTDGAPIDLAAARAARR